MDNLMARIEKLAALGALGVAGGAMAGWVGFLWLMRPVATGGMEPVLHFCLAAASFVVFALLSAAHLWFGLQLKRGPISITG